MLTAENAQAALQVVEREGDSIDLVLTDLVMPDISGRDLAARLAQLRPSLKVLYMSGYSSDMIARHGILEDGLTLVEKPFSPEQLTQKVREVLGPPKSLNRVLLLADDDVGSQLRVWLSRGGYDVVEAADVNQVEKVGQANPVDLIITEVPRAEQQAIDTVQGLRKEMPGAAIIVILEASGGLFLEMERRIAADGAIAKPVSVGFLLKTVREVLGRKG